jgi:hypothetical protein
MPLTTSNTLELLYNISRQVALLICNQVLVKVLSLAEQNVGQNVSLIVLDTVPSY